MFKSTFLLAQEAVSSTTGSLFDIGQDERFVVLLTLIGCITAGVLVSTAMICHLIGAIHRRSAEYNLKREMLDRGMSAEEITEVIEAAPPPEDGFERWMASWGKSDSKKK